MIEWIEMHPVAIGFAVTFVAAVWAGQWRLLRYLARIEAQFKPNGTSTPRKGGDGYYTVREEIDAIRELAVTNRAKMDLHWSLHDAQHNTARERFEDLKAIVQRAHPE